MFVFIAEVVEWMVEPETERTSPLGENKETVLTMLPSARRSIFFFLKWCHWRSVSSIIGEKRVSMWSWIMFATIDFDSPLEGTTAQSSYRHSCPWSTNSCLSYSSILILKWDNQHETPLSKWAYPCWERWSPSSLLLCMERLRRRLVCPNKQTITTNEV